MLVDLGDPDTHRRAQDPARRVGRDNCLLLWKQEHAQPIEGGIESDRMALAIDHRVRLVGVLDRLDAPAIQALPIVVHPECLVPFGIRRIDDRGLGQIKVDAHVARAHGLRCPHPDQQRCRAIAVDMGHRQAQHTMCIGRDATHAQIAPTRPAQASGTVLGIRHRHRRTAMRLPPQRHARWQRDHNLTVARHRQVDVRIHRALLMIELRTAETVVEFRHVLWKFEDRTAPGHHNQEHGGAWETPPPGTTQRVHFESHCDGHLHGLPARQRQLCSGVKRTGIGHGRRQLLPSAVQNSRLDTRQGTGAVAPLG